ncbi:MAG: pseudouridine synthase [Ignavibacteria bacterium]
MIRKKSQGDKKFSPKKDGYGKKSTGVKKEFPAKRKYSGKKDFSGNDDFTDKREFSDKSFQKDYYGKKESRGVRKFSDRSDKSFKKESYGKKENSGAKKYSDRSDKSFKKETYSKKENSGAKKYSDRSDKKDYYSKKDSSGAKKYSDRSDKTFKKETYGRKENSGTKKYSDRPDNSFKKEYYGKKENSSVKKYSDSSDKQGFYSRKENKSSNEYSERKESYGKKVFKDTKDSSGKKYYKEKSDFYGRKDYSSRNELSDKKRYAKKKKIAPIIKDPDSTEVYVKKEGEEGLIRLNKFIAANGIASRRKVDEMIEQGRVTVNKKTITELGFKIDEENDKVKVDGEPVKTDTKKVYIMMNKPKGVITSVSDEKKRTTVVDLINLNQKIYPVGRLDYNTSGMLLLTNDGEFANHLMSPKNKVHKKYYVELSKPLEEKHRIKLSEGIKLEGIRTAPAKIKFLKDNDYTRLYISIYEGRNRQIHNMFEHYGYFVRELIRVEYGGLKMEGLAEGSWRYLTAVEIAKLK